MLVGKLSITRNFGNRLRAATFDGEGAMLGFWVELFAKFFR